jgi:hypothetical protein
MIACKNQIDHDIASVFALLFEIILIPIATDQAQIDRGITEAKFQNHL